MLDLAGVEPLPILCPVRSAPGTPVQAGSRRLPHAGRHRWGAIALSIVSGLTVLADGWQPLPAQAKPVTAALAAEFGLKPLSPPSRSVPVLPSIQPLSDKALPASDLPGDPQRLQNQACAVSTAAPPPARVYAFATHLTNYGDRLALDAHHQRVPNRLSLIVLHETVGSVSSVLHLFKQPPRAGRPPVSYHALIARDGTIIQTVPPEMRALGAADSAFHQETVQLNPKLPGSVNNFAYQISLETPPDGMNNQPQHSGYTTNQYRSLAYWTGLIMQTYGVPWGRITTHKAVDRSGSRQDPRSFNWQRFKQQLPKPPLVACHPTPLRSS